VVYIAAVVADGRAIVGADIRIGAALVESRLGFRDWLGEPSLLRCFGLVGERRRPSG
jgi:hypothetical protein